jgi:hypothetical protein
MDIGSKVPNGVSSVLNRRELNLGRTEFPSPTAGNGKQVVDRYTGMPDGWACRQCGFWCSAQRVAVPGTINEGNGDITFVPVTGGSEPVVGRGGCPFCGSGNSR